MIGLMALLDVPVLLHIIAPAMTLGLKLIACILSPLQHYAGLHDWGKAEFCQEV